MLIGMILGFGLAWVTNNALGWTLVAIAGASTHDQKMVAQGIGLAAYIAAGGLCGYAVLRSMRGGMASLWTSTLGRWVIGRVAGAAVYGALVAALWLPALYVVAFLVGSILSIAGAQALVPLVRVFQVLIWIVALGAAWPLRTPVKVWIGKYSRPVRRLYRSLRMGRGGSSAFAGILEEWACRWKPGMILLGASMFDRRWLVGKQDDRGHGVVAGNGAGKGRSSIIPNLLTYPGSIYVQDFKGQNAAVTAQARRDMGQTVHILEPMGKGGAQWNPLEPLDPAAADYVEQIDAIVDALVIAGDGKNLFWDESARTLIAGLIDYVVRRDRDDEFVPPVEDTEMEEVNA
jgi:hypothetical protein